MATPPGSPPRNQLIPAMPRLIRRELAEISQAQVLARHVNNLRRNIQELQRHIPRVNSNARLHTTKKAVQFKKSKSTSNLMKMR